MKRMLFALAVVALAAPFAALAADPGSGNGASPAQACNTEQAAMGHDAFKALYGTNADKSNAFGKCVAKKATQRAKSQSNAVSACRAEQADTTFATNHGGKTFDQVYGTGKNGKTAWQVRLVEGERRPTTAPTQTSSTRSSSVRPTAPSDPAAFENTYGKNRNKANASASASRRPRRRTRRTTPRSRNKVPGGTSAGCREAPRFSCAAATPG